MAALTEGFRENETADNTLPEIFQDLTGTSSHRREGQATRDFSTQQMAPPYFLSEVVRLCEDRRVRVPQKPSPISLGVSCADPAEHHPRCSIVARSAVVGATPGNPTIISAASTRG